MARFEGGGLLGGSTSLCKMVEWENWREGNLPFTTESIDESDSWAGVTDQRLKYVHQMWSGVPFQNRTLTLKLHRRLRQELGCRTGKSREPWLLYGCVSLLGDPWDPPKNGVGFPVGFPANQPRKGYPQQLDAGQKG